MRAVQTNRVSTHCPRQLAPACPSLPARRPAARPAHACASRAHAPSWMEPSALLSSRAMPCRTSASFSSGA